MLSIPVYSETGQQVGSEEIDEALLGGAVNTQLLKQAVVRYQANRRQGDSCQKTRGEVEGSTRKLYKQKGTGRARRGNIRTPVMRGGGRAFPNKPTDHSQAMPKKMRRLARDQAVLAKIKSDDAVILESLPLTQPATKRFAAMLKAVRGDRGCLLATNGRNEVLYKSGRNIPRTRVMDVAELNALDVLAQRKLIFLRDAFAAFRNKLSGRKAGE